MNIMFKRMFEYTAKIYSLKILHSNMTFPKFKQAGHKESISR